MTVLYFHGFASSPQSQKLVALKRLLEPGLELNAPDMNVPSFERLDFEAMVKLAVDEARRRPPQAIVGSSLGSLVALELVRRGVVAPLVLIAPAVGIGERWRSKLPAGDPIEVFNHARNAQAKIHRAFFEKMTTIHPESEAPARRVTVIIGRRDESVPFEWVRGVWEEWTRSGKLLRGSKFVEIAEGDHGLVAFVDVIAGEIRNIIGHD
ncbi:MAG TPA: YqiA/YcfP family alpha/beta fold hydrolase [Thermoanaerobaculia bacterium]|jgi:alpha-beta hydrolase superfamily lysophospholipase|nr:YqiA/YcfP family alpha/beta fold hydrolase [Thermoanaerobaculia bacterium]